ncbi:glycoside hydrolase family 2 protein [Lentzea sp.]|uniref:glycoside hydrolase family 2 protein n=1 Tax=Lentzea sp. TaxID=56099 RepID=UPI002C49C4E5|nr:sugar-binding domain-containing protein [Lentzea sp.]HUQ54662.1 glycoside hydrolase family 2 TIM barrel-domain containing protein [Lentzea sp.]
MIHPRPQLTRASWTDLCGEWEFAHDDADTGLDEHWHSGGAAFDRVITVPYPPESAASGIGDTGPHPVVWYRRTVDVEAEGHRVLLHFGAVDYRASVWVNGQLVATHEGGHTPFSADITPALREGREQMLVVRAEDRNDPHQPRGKQDWRDEPHDIWYHRTTGIWQPVWLERVPKVWIDSVRWTPKPFEGLVELEAAFGGTPAGHRLDVRLRLGDEVLAEQSAVVRGDRARLTLHLPAAENRQELGRLLWSPEQPVLIDADLELSGTTGTDVVRSYLGLREIGVREGRFTLNDAPYFPRMVLAQGYWPDTHLAASDDDLLREVRLVKELGFNGVRVHQKVEDPRFLHHCDRLGLLVWGELPSAYAFSPTSAERLCREWTEVVRRDVSHPCVVAWVPLNESWGVDHLATDPAQRALATALYHLTKALDPTRPVISNDGWEHTVSDIYGLHDYTPTAAGLVSRYGSADRVESTVAGSGPAGRRLLLEGRVPGVPVMLSEYGGLSFTPRAGEEWHGYATLADADALLERYDELTSALLGSPAVAGFCYTQLTDTLQETNGLLTADRRPKLPVDEVRRITTRPAAAIPVEEVAEEYRQAKSRARGE